MTHTRSTLAMALCLFGAGCAAEDPDDGGADTASNSGTTEIGQQTYEIDLQRGTATLPANSGPAVLDVVGETVLAGLTIGATSLDGVIATSEGDGQDPCGLADGFAGASYAGDAAIDAGPTTFEIVLEGAYSPLHDAHLTGILSDDSTRLNDAVLTGSMDLRPLSLALYPDDPENTFCELMGGFGESCEACADGTDHCIAIRIEDLTGTAVDTEVTARLAADVAADADCAM